MKKPIKAVVFDLDGTFLDTAPDFVYVLNKLREEEGLPPLDSTAIRNTVSHGARALVTLGFQLAEDDEGFEPLRLRLLDLYAEHLAVSSAPFDGIADLLTFLQDNQLAWGIATNKPELYTTPLLAALKLTPDCVICPDHVEQSKPHPESMYLAAELLKCQANEIIYVGDHARDIECGRQAGCPTIAAAYGYISHDDNIDDWQADHRVEHAREIIPIVKGYL
ncbi:HAD-IA family hydrolase [Aestuariicella hydrocarbonica]|uniref:HAD-IA family hydrolase n=1 Tax=Pseudomaricurvus hydrocarbonicus TaxID=1470433 RepID=A0A9E5JYJ4_9GAMM|nr:HAD-IA family hydrolase [Aestuariicella hydrocarbonica]NHO64487.1 HAD-IA family hydrolase [Aestuariicella hydrocarbonica]